MKITISTTQQKAIKEVLGWGYAKEIVKHLNKRKIYSANNVPYSTSYIRMIFNNQKTSNLIVKEIFKLYKKTKLKQEKEQQAHDKLFNS